MWPNTHVQTNQGLNAAIRKVRLALGDSSEESRYIETLGSRGYRFIHPYEIVGWTEASRSKTALRIAVLPTEAVGGIMQDQVLGFSTELSKMLRNQAPQVTVVSNGDLRERNLQGRAIDEIGRALHVEFVVAARVRRIRNKLRLTTMLFQSDDTQCIWAETYEHAPEEFVKQRTALADEVARSLRLKMMQKPD